MNHPLSTFQLSGVHYKGIHFLDPAGGLGRDPKAQAFYGDILTLLGFIFIRGFIWDIPILIFAYVLFGGPR